MEPTSPLAPRPTRRDALKAGGLALLPAVQPAFARPAALLILIVEGEPLAAEPWARIEGRDDSVPAVRLRHARGRPFYVAIGPREPMTAGALLESCRALAIGGGPPEDRYYCSGCDREGGEDACRHVRAAVLAGLL